MAEPKPRPTKASVSRFIAGVTPERRRVDALAVSKLMRRVSGEAPTMWGASLVLDVSSGFPRFDALVARLGKIKVHGGCLHVSDLAGADTQVLERFVRESVEAMRKRRPVGKAPATKALPSSRNSST